MPSDHSLGADRSPLDRIRLRVRYVLVERDLDEPAMATWRRLVGAVAQAEAAASASPVVDGIEARVILRDQQWDIARALAAQTRLRQGPRSLEQIRALAKAVASTRQRVDSIVAYAGQLAALAGQAGQAGQGEQDAAIAARDGQFREVLAATAADDLAMKQLDEMTSRARQLSHPTEQIQPPVQ